MKHLTIAAIAAFAFLSPQTVAQAQQLTVEDALAIRDRAGMSEFASRAEWSALTYYLQGVIEGVAAYQQTLIEQGRPALFCPPADKRYSIDEFFRYLTNSTDEDSSRPATLVIVEAYADAYPCPESVN